MIKQPLKTDKLHLQAQEHLLNLIRSGAYQPGEKLPSEIELAAQLGISRPTLREALLHLAQKGVIVRKHGVGTFVANGYRLQLEAGLERLESVLQMGARQGMHTSVEGLQTGEEPAIAEVADKLHIAPGTALTSIRRVIAVDGTPVAYMVDVVPPDILSTTDIDADFQGSVLDQLREKQDLRIAQAVADIIPVNADAFLAERLGVAPGQALLLLEEVLFNGDGAPVEFSRNYFIPDFFRFHVLRR